MSSHTRGTPVQVVRKKVKIPATTPYCPRHFITRSTDLCTIQACPLRKRWATFSHKSNIILCKIYDEFEEESIERIDFMDILETEFLKERRVDQTKCYAAVLNNYSKYMPHETNFHDRKIKRKTIVKSELLENGREVIIIADDDSTFTKVSKKRKIDKKKNEITTTNNTTTVQNIVQQDDCSRMCLKHKLITVYRFDECTEECPIKRFRTHFSKKLNHEMVKLYKQMPNASVRAEVRKFVDETFMSKLDIITCYDLVRNFMKEYIDDTHESRKIVTTEKSPLTKSEKNPSEISSHKHVKQNQNGHSVSPNCVQAITPIKAPQISENVSPNMISPTVPTRLLYDDIRSHELTEKKSTIINKIKTSFQIPVNVSLNDISLNALGCTHG
jgi:hypothetical protein